MTLPTINRNTALETSFKLEIPGLEEFNYFVQEAALPGLSMAGVDLPFRNNQASVPSNRIDYESVQIPFVVAEDFLNHSAIRLWMHRISKGPGPLINELKDVTLHLLNSNKNTIKRVVYYSAYPTALTGIPLRSNVPNTGPLFCTLSLKYQYYDVLPSL